VLPHKIFQDILKNFDIFKTVLNRNKVLLFTVTEGSEAMPDLKNIYKSTKV